MKDKFREGFISPISLGQVSQRGNEIKCNLPGALVRIVPGPWPFGVDLAQRLD